MSRNLPYNFNEHIECVDSIAEILIVSYPKRENISVEIWATKPETNTYQLADVFYDAVSQKNIAKIFIDSQECNFAIEDLINGLQSAVALLPNDFWKNTLAVRFLRSG